MQGEVQALLDDSDVIFSELADFICPISHGIMHDPVFADDGHSYERESIQGWFRTCRERGWPISSPWTRAPISENLRENPDLKRRIANAVHERSFVTGLEGVSSIHELNAVFAQLDPLREIFAETLKGWRPPQLVVIGAESSGKSSLLERLVMMPIFPTAEGICTRLPIHVRLRNTPQAHAPQLEVYSLARGQTEEGPYEVPMQSGAIDVRDKMQEILDRENIDPAYGVSMDRIIILHVQGPHVPSLDVVDLPGLIAAPASPRKKTRRLVDMQVAQHGAYSMYLAVVQAGTRPNTSPAMEVVKDMGLEERSLGVFTKCDDLTVSNLAKLRQHLQANADPRLGSVPLAPYGWYAVMNAPVEGLEGENNAGRLRRQAKAEDAFVLQHMPEEVAEGRAGCRAVVRGLSGMFLSYVKKKWAPTTLRLLNEAIEAARKDDIKLGVPELMGRTADEVALAKQLATKAVCCAIDSGYEGAGQLCCREILEPLRAELETIMRKDSGCLRAEKATSLWSAEAQAVNDVSRRAILKWQKWWVEQITGLMQEEGGTDFVVGRFPLFLEAVVRRVVVAAEAAGGTVAVEVGTVVQRFYEDTSPWARFTMDLRAVPATVRVVREGEQLLERVILSFLRGGQAVVDGVLAIVELAAEDVEDWAESCCEARRRVAARMARVADAKAGVLRALGVASAEELPAEEYAITNPLKLYDEVRTVTNGHVNSPGYTFNYQRA